MTALDEFLHACSTEIVRRAALPGDKHAVLTEGAAALSEALEHSSPIFCAPSSVPVATCLADAAPGPLVTQAQACGDEIPWIASHRLSDEGTEAALAPLDQVRDFGDVTVGLLLLGPGCSYPKHSHPPQELYLPISGAGQWLYGGNADYQPLADDALVYNHPNDYHGVHAPADAPLLALYVLWP